jgi:mannose-6-phosphate isomerase-like protein (cupin superfamily)
MNHIFRPGSGDLVPDGTLVFPFLNPTDSTNNLPVDLMTDVSLALGEIAPRHASKIHVHPVVMMIVWVIAGSLHLKLKDQEANTPYSLILAPEEAAVVHPGTFIQLINEQDEPCRVLYIVSPPYVSAHTDTGAVLYQDAIVLESDWNALTYQSLDPCLGAEAARLQAIEHLQARKGTIAQS